MERNEETRKVVEGIAMNAKHTPGPVALDDDYGGECLLAADGTLIAICAIFGVSREPEENKANAAHFASCWNACDGINPDAVPDMAEALAGMLEIFQDAVTPSEMRGEWRDRYTAATSALKKAGVV